MKRAPLLLAVLFIAWASAFAQPAPPSAFSVAPVEGKYGWRRIQLMWTPTAPETCIYRDGFFQFCSSGRASGYYGRHIYGKTYIYEARSRENGIESTPLTVQYTPPPWTASPNVGPQRVNAVFLIFPDWTAEPFSIEQAQVTLNTWAREIEIESFGKLQMASTAYGWLMMPKPITEYCESTSSFSGLWMYCDSVALGVDARKLALVAGATAQIYEPVWLVYAGVAFSGYGMSIGASPSNGFGKGVDVLHHEWGHVVCCLHGGALQFASPAIPEDSPPDLMNINGNGYGDNYSLMGVPIPAGMGHYHVSDKIFFGWIDPARSKWIETSGQFWLDSAVDPNGPVVEHKIWIQEPDLYYSLEHRRDLGGALVRLHIGYHGFGQIEHLIMNRSKPITPSGDSFIDPHRGVTISAERVEGSRILLSYNLSWAPVPPDPNVPPVDPNEPEPPGTRCGDGTCDEGETCKTCLSDCPGKQTGKPSRRYCCGNGIAEPAEARICPENR